MKILSSTLTNFSNSSRSELSKGRAFSLVTQASGKAIGAVRVHAHKGMIQVNSFNGKQKIGCITPLTAKKIVGLMERCRFSKNATGIELFGNRHRGENSAESDERSQVLSALLNTKQPNYSSESIAHHDANLIVGVQRNNGNLEFRVGQNICSRQEGFSFMIKENDKEKLVSEFRKAIEE